MLLCITTSLNPKGVGSFVPHLTAVGGGADSAAPSDSSAVKRQKIMKFGIVRRVSQYERADKIAILKIQKRF